MSKKIVFLLVLILILQAVAGAEGIPISSQPADLKAYVDVGDGEGYARLPDNYTDQMIRLDGEVLAQKAEGEGFEAYVSLLSNPGIVFAVRYRLAAGQPLFLAGDLVSAYGVFQGLLPFDASGTLTDGAPLLLADWITGYLPPPKPKAAGAYAGTREEPAPLDVKAHYEGSYWSDYASFDLTLTQTLRGNEAQRKARSLNPYNIVAPKGMEYILVTLQVQATAAPGGRAAIDNRDFYFVSASGKEYRQHFLISDQQTLGNLYSGDEHTFILACLIERGDLPLIVFLPESTNPLWFDPNPR